MIAWIRHRLELRRRRAETLRALQVPGVVIRSGRFSCYLCGEKTVGIHKIISRTSPAGETFTWASEWPRAWACLRCQVVAHSPEVTGPTQWSLAEWGKLIEKK